MPIDAMSRTLCWQNDDQTLDVVHDAYIELLLSAFGRLTGDLCLADPAAGNRLIGMTQSASDQALMRVLTAPETSYRLLWRRSHRLSETADFLFASLDVESAAQGGPPVCQETWTALGDLCCYPDGRVEQMPQIKEWMPLDFGSPHATKIDLTGDETEDAAPRPGFDAAEMLSVLQKLGEAQEGILKTGAVVAEFTRRFNKVLILQKDPSAPLEFASGSRGQYIGRSFLSNPQETFATPPVIADAIVHEGIHALLYMQEQETAWVVDPDLYGPARRVRSPWSGSRLALRPYLQACFVWYGLLHFWGMARVAQAFDSQSIDSLLLRALRGFLGESLLTPIAEYIPAINSALLDVISTMQTNVQSQWAESN